MESEQNNEPIFRPVEVDLHSSGDTGFLGWSSPNIVEHEASTTDDRNSLENKVSRVSSPLGVDRDEGLIAFMRTVMNSLNEKMDKNNEELKKNNEELRDLNYKIDQNNEELKTEIQRSNEQLKRDMEQMRGELNNKIVDITEVMRVEIYKDLNTLNKELKNLEEGVRLEISEQAEKNKGERSKLKSQVRGEVTTEIKKLKDKREEDMREIEKRFVHIEDDKKKIDQRLEKLNKRFKTRLDELNGRVDRDRTNLELDQDGENGKASKDVENKSITSSSLQEIEDMGNRVEKSLNKRLDETLGKLENKQTQLENMMRNQSMEKERYENNKTRYQRDRYEYTRGRGSMRGNRQLEENRMENKWVGQARMKETIEKKEPNFEGYQMIGDSQLRRFGEKIMNLRGEYREKGGKRINLCIGGQTIEQLTRELKHTNNLERQLIVMIGTNDLLRDKEVKSICNDYDKLVEVLLEKAEKIILVTIPPIPKLAENDRYHLNKLERI
ncbi:hypothetical protein J6590_092643 [Homalodisca vitripennis]|nr:hypothetical protein J6590_092643 [Homalodisca vitripennis]